MAVQLIIDGAHITDVLAQVQTLAGAISGAEPKNVVGGKTQSSGSTTSAASTPKPSAQTSTEATVDSGKLSRDEQDAAVEEMVQQGFKDPRFDQLTKGRQKDVETRLAEKEKAETASVEKEDLDDMFGDEEVKTETVTVDTIRDIMGKLGKDAKGEPNQENLVKIKAVLTKYVPKGEEVKVGKIPQDKLAAAYAELKKIG